MYNQSTMDLLLTTKLHIPPVGPSLVPRRRLIARIDEGLSQSSPGGGFARKLTLLSAPAGFGKTTLLSEWAAVSQLVTRDGNPADRAASKTSDPPRITTRVAWLSLDEADNDPVRFLSYLIAALQTVELDLGRDLLPILQSPGLNPDPDSLPANQSVLQLLSLPLEELLTSLINQVQALAGRGLVLVLDDCHLVSARIVHRALAFLLEYLPGNLHLIIATRADPPLPLARLRGRGQLTEIRQGDLSFSPEEVAELLNRVMGLSLSNREVAALTSRTEGWAAGLQMACLALRATLSRPDRTAGDFDSFIRAFSGTDRYVLDYLAEEVLQNQPEEIQTFLLRSSILDRFCAPLCDAIVEHGSDGGPHPTSGSSSQQIIEQLEAENLFVISLDDERAWYRYHRLFADLLRRRLHWRVGAEDRKLLHRRASLWFEEQGSLPEAIDHALEGEDFERAAALVERVAEATLMRSEVTTYLGWVERLPEEVERDRPALCLLHAWALLLGGRSLEAVESRLQEAAEGAALSPGQAMPLRAFVATLQGQIPRAASLSRQALVQLPEDEVFLRGIATYTLGVAHLLGGDVEAATQALEEAVWASELAGNVMVAVMALCALAELYAALAQLRRAEEAYRRALDLATGEYGRDLPISGMALIGLGELNREWNNLEAATGYLEEGIERAKAWTELGASDGCLALARVKQAQGDAGGAQEMMRQAQELAARAGTSHLSDAILEAYQARLWISQGNLAAAERWSDGQGLAPSLLEGVRVEGVQPWEDLLAAKEGGLSVDYHLRKYEHLVWARLLLAQNRPGQALAVVDPFLAAMDQVGGQGSAKAIELLILRALSLQGLGDIANALETLAGALSLAEPGGYVRLFLDEGEPMARLLHTAVDRNIEPNYVGRLLSTYERGSSDQVYIPVPPPEPIVHHPPSPLVEPLTEREQEVLGLLATHLNSTEIAGQLCISPHTVRYHIKSIYGKLGVHRRTEAVERARDLDLL